MQPRPAEVDRKRVAVVGGGGHVGLPFDCCSATSAIRSPSSIPMPRASLRSGPAGCRSSSAAPTSCSPAA